MTAIDRPIFLIGTGRCGSSLLYRLLGYHPDVAWLSHYTARFGGHFAALQRVHDLPGLQGWLPRATDAKGSRLVPQPTEHYGLLRAATDGLFTAPRELRADEATPQAIARLRAMVGAHVAASGKPRFAMKHTGFPRVAYLRAAFPDARFVHVRRDGRAVASSLCQVDWWSGEGHWGWGALSPDDLAAYHASGRHELVLAALYWKVLMRQLEAARDAVPTGQFHEVRYDALVADPVGVMTALAADLGLRPHPRFDARLAATPMRSDDTRWRRTLSAEEQELLEGVLHADLARWGFEPSAATPPSAP
jgi:hypothetical protein